MLSDIEGLLERDLYIHLFRKPTRIFLLLGARFTLLAFAIILPCHYHFVTRNFSYVWWVKQVPFSRSSLNHFDVFILDTSSKIFLFSGCNSSTQERAKALEVVQYIKENKHNGNCQVVTVG